MKLRRTLRIILLTAVVAVALCAAVLAADYTAENGRELYLAMKDAMSQQKKEFTVDFYGDEIPAAAAGRGLVNPAILARGMTAELPNDDGTGADTLMLNIKEASAFMVGATIYFRFDYLLDPQQLAWVDTQVDEICDSLQLTDVDDYMKIKRIYQYMGTHFTYDNTLTKYTDYDGLTTGQMVCQGYALLTYKLLWHAGVPARIVVGTSQGEQHGWNIVKLNGKWYNLDTTWDAAVNSGSVMYWDYFLKSESDFQGHIRDARFATADFHQTCPMAKESYSVPTVDILLDGTIYSSLTIRNGQTIQFGYTLNPDSDTTVSWASSDPAVASITEDGLLESLTPGDVYITATPSDDSYIAGTFPVTAVELRTCSSWAEEELNRFYLRKFYPAALCSDYQTAIHRDEFARLLYLILDDQKAAGGGYTLPAFTDITQSKYWFSIVTCSHKGIFEGTSETTFSPESPLTREQAAKLLCRLLDYLEVKTESTAPAVSFADEAEISDWARPYVDRASAAGILLGSNGSFLPRQTVSREQAAVMLERLYVDYLQAA